MTLAIIISSASINFTKNQTLTDYYFIFASCQISESKKTISLHSASIEESACSRVKGFFLTLVAFCSCCWLESFSKLKIHLFSEKSLKTSPFLVIIWNVFLHRGQIFWTLFWHKEMNHSKVLIKALANYTVLTVSPSVQSVCHSLELSGKSRWSLRGWTLKPFGTLMLDGSKAEW